MTGVKSLDKFLEFFNSNASGVIGTITNQPITFSTKNYSDFDLSLLETNVSIPCVMITINFTGNNDFQMQIVASKQTIAALADLMMLGTGEVEYVPEEHHDGVQEMLNQVLGSMTTELHAEGITSSGNVTEISLNDMEIHKEFLQENKMVEISFELLGLETFFYLLFEQTALGTLDAVFNPQKAAPPPPPKSSSSKQSSSKAAPKAEPEPVAASRASFAEIEEIRPSGAKGVNIDILLHIDLPVTVELGSKDMRIKEILDLGQGSVVELNKLAGDLVDLKINGKKFATGEVMVVDENYAIRIVNLISREERIRTLGPE
ncbi:MAG: flagellar motor switch protein FliN [Candidatus Cloacimonetes bacterium]|nr:flagellar motor switch protein FliN [Candidatus Cloacimonadota bacterium]